MGFDETSQAIVGLTWLEWSNSYLEIVGGSLAAVLTPDEKSRLGAIYLDLIPTIFELNAKVAKGKQGVLILFPQGIFLLPILNAYVYQALLNFENLQRAVDYSDWRIRLRVESTLRAFGKRGSFKGFSGETAKLIHLCIDTIASFDDLLRISVGMDSSDQRFPALRIEDEAWRFSDAVTRYQWSFVLAHELGHILARNYSAATPLAKETLPRNLGLRSFLPPSHLAELEADRWAVMAILRNAAKREIRTPLDMLFFVMRCFEETQRFRSCKAAIERGKPEPSRVGDHPSADVRRAAISDKIGGLPGKEGTSYIEELLIAHQKRELVLPKED